MHKPLITTLLLLLLMFAGAATASADEHKLVQINATHWYFETTQTELTAGEYNYQAFIPDNSSDYRILEYSTTPTITLLAQDPAALFQNSTGTFNQTWGISHPLPLNTSTITYIYHNIADHDPYHSLRMPVNDRAPTGWRGDNRNGSGADRMTMEGNTTIFGSDIWTWGGKDLNSTRMTIEVVNSTYAKIHINCTIQCLVTSNSWYLNRKELQESAKTQIDIDKGQTWLVKFFDPEVLAGRDTNYTASFWIDTTATTSAPPAPGDTLYIYYANGSFDPTGGINIKDSPYGELLGSLNYTQWLDHKYSPNPSKYIRFDVYAGSFPDITLDTAMYVCFEFDSPKKFKLNVTDVATSTNMTFGETGVLWQGTLTGSTYTASPYTPNIFMTFHRGNQTFESRMWAMDTDGTLVSSNLEQTLIAQSEFMPIAPTFHQFEFAGHNDTSMDCTYRDNITIWLDPGSDPDGGNVTTNLTLWTADRTTCVAIINASIPGGSGMLPIILNTTPHHSTTTLYTLRGVVIDDEFASSTRWLPVNFALSPLGTTGSLVDGDRITFWGLDDVPALYTAIGDPTAISLSGGIYTFHKAMHQSQYGDVWNVSSDIRIISTPYPDTLYGRYTGTVCLDGAIMTSWNETAGTPAQPTDAYRSYMYTDEYYSRIDILNSSISYMGRGSAPYQGVYLQNGEGATIDNNTFSYNEYGIYIKNGGNFSITNNTITDTTGLCMDIEDTNGNTTVSANLITSDVETAGIRIRNGGSDNEFVNNTITGQVQSAIYARYISDSILKENTLNSIQFGISLSFGCENITINNNTINAEMDALGNPAWAIMILSGSGHNLSNNVITAQNGYGVDLWQCFNITMTNNSVTTNAGTHPDAGTFADYLFEGTTTGNIIRDPFDTHNIISLYSDVSDVRVENTDNTVFSEDSTNDSYAYPTNFSLFADTQQLFNITQQTMTATPATDSLRFWNFEWGTNVTWNASTDTAGNQVWFNATKSEWVDENISVYRNGTEYYNATADANGTFLYNYSGGWSELYFALVGGAAHGDPVTNLHTTTLVYNRIVWEWTNPDHYDTIMVYVDNVWKQNTTGAYYSASGLAQTTTYTIKLITVYAGIESAPVTDTQLTPAEQGGGGGGGGTPTPTPTPTATATPITTPSPGENVTENMSIIVEPIPEITNDIVMNDTISATVWHLSFDKHGVFVPQHANIIACNAIPPYACRYYADQKKFEIVIDGESPNPIFTTDQWVTFVTRDGTRISQRISTKVYNPLFYFTMPAISGSVGDFSRYFVHGNEHLIDGVRFWWLGLLGIGFVTWLWRRKT